MKAFILLLLYCPAFLTNVEFGGARKTSILYYVRGLEGGYPFSYGIGPGSNIGLSPSATIPLAAANADDIENLHVSTLSQGQNAGFGKTLGSSVTNSGAGKLDDASAPSVAFSSSINTSVGLIGNPFNLGGGIIPNKVLSGGTKSAQPKSSGGNAPSISTIRSLGPIKITDESPSGEGGGSFVHDKLSGSSLTVHLFKSLTSNTGSDKASLSSRISSLTIGTTSSGDVKDNHKGTVKTQREATVNGDLPAPRVGPTSISALAQTGPTDSSGPGRTVSALSGHGSFNRESGGEGAISTSSISTPSVLPSRHDSSASGNKSSGSAPGNTVSPSAGRSGIPSLPPIHSRAATLPSHAGELIFSKSEPARNLPLDMTETLSRIKDHNNSASNRNTKSGLSLGTSESAAGLSPSVSLPFRDLPGKVNESGVVSTVVSRQSSPKSVPGLSKKVYVENSAKRFGKNSSDNINVHLKEQNSVIPGMTGSALGAIHTVALVKNEQENHNILETALKKTSGASDGRARGDLHGSSGSNSIHKSKPLAVAVNSVIPPKRGSPFRYSSAPLGDKLAPAITKTERALSENAPSVGKPISGIIQDVIRKTPENNQEARSSSHKNFRDRLNTKSSVPLLALGGSAKPHLGILETLKFTGQNGLGLQPIQNAAVKVTNGVPNATNKQQIRSNRAYGLFADTSLPSGFSISSTGVPTGLRSNMFHSSKRLGYNTVGAARVPSTNAERFLSNESHANVGRFLDDTPRPPALNSRVNGPHVFVIHPSGLSSGKSQSSTAIRTPDLLVHVQASPSNGNTGYAEMLRNVPSLSNPPGFSQNRGDYGSFIHTDLPSRFSTSSTGAPTGAGMLIYHASTAKKVPPPTGIIGATTTTDHPIHPNDVREHEGLPGSSPKMDAQYDQRHPTHDREIERLGSDTSEPSVTPTASHPLGHNQVSSAYGHTGAVAKVNKVPDLLNPSLPHQRAGAYSFFPYKSLPSGISIIRVRTPAAVGSSILRASKYFKNPSNLGMVITAGTNDRPSRTAEEVLNDAGRSSSSMVRTQMQYHGSTVLPVPGLKPLGSINDISKSHALNKDSDTAITDQAYPITRKIGAEYMLMEAPGIIIPTKYPNRNEAYDSLGYANRPPGFSTSATGVPMKVAANTLPSAKLLEVSAKSGPIGATGILRQSSFSEVAGEHMRGFSAIRTGAQVPNIHQHRAQFHGRANPGYGSGILESFVPSTVSQPSVHMRASTPGNAGAPRPLMNARSFINLPSSGRMTEARQSFTHVTSPLGLQISRTEAPIGVGFDGLRPSEHLGGSSTSSVTSATVAPAMPSGYSEARDLKTFTASKGRANIGIHSQYPSPTFRHQMPGIASGISRLSLPIKMSHPFGRMQPSLSTDTVGSVHLLQNVPGLSNQHQFSQRHASYDPLIYSTSPPGISSTNSRTSAGAHSRIFRSYERLQGYTTPGFINSGSTEWPLNRSAIHQDLRGNWTSNTTHPVASHRIQSYVLGEQTYGFSSITNPSTNLNGDSNLGNAGVLGSVRELDGTIKASQPNKVSFANQRATSDGEYSISPQSASLTKFGSASLANDEGHLGFRPPGTLRSFVRTELPQSARMWPPPTLAGTRNSGGHSHTIGYRTQPQQAQFGSPSTYSFRYPGALDSRSTMIPTSTPAVAVPKVTDPSKHVGGPAGSPFTLTGGNERPTNPTYVSAFNSDVNAERQTVEPEVSSSSKYLPGSITSSSYTPKVDSYEPGRRQDFRNFEIGSHPLKSFSNQRVPVPQHFTINGWKTTPEDSRGDHASTVRRSLTATGIGDVGSTIRLGDSAYKPEYPGHSDIVKARRRFLSQLRLKKATKPTGRFFAAGGVLQPGNSGAYNLPVSETHPPSFHNGFTRPAHEAGFETYNVLRNLRDNAGYKINTALKDLKRQSTLTTTSEYETGHHSIYSREPKPTNEYRFIPDNIHSRNRILSTRIRSDKAYTLSGASNRLEDDTGSPSIEAGRGWPVGFGEARIASRGFIVDSTRHIFPGTGTSSSASEGRGRSVIIGGREGYPNRDTTMNSILNGRLRGSMSSYPRKYKSSRGPLVPYFPKHGSGSRFSSAYNFDVGLDSGRGNTDNARFPVTTAYRAIPASPGSNTGYPINNPLYRSDGSRGYLSQSNSRRDFSVYSGTYGNRGRKSYQAYFLPHSASGSYVSSQDNTEWNTRSASQGISWYPTSDNN